jgi:hypothetical protein
MSDISMVVYKNCVIELLNPSWYTETNFRKQKNKWHENNGSKNE